MKIRKISFHFIVILVLILLRSGVFDMFEINNPVFGNVRIRDLYFIIEILWFGYVFFTCKGYKIRTRFNGIIWSFIGIIIINCFVSNAIFDQPLLLGLQAQRDIVSGFCVFLAIDSLLYYNKISKKALISFIKWIAIIQLFLNSVDYYVYTFTGNKILQSAFRTAERYGSARILYSQVEIIVILIGLSVEEILQGKKNLFWNIVIIMWGLAYFMLITKLRAYTLACIIALVFTFLIWKKASAYKIIICIMMAIFVILTAGKIPILQDLIGTLFKGTSTSVDTTLIRSSARSYYIDRFLKSPIVGWGFPHSDCEAAFSAQGKSLGYFFTDNGVFSFMYIYGILGILWLLKFIARYIHLTIYQVKINSSYANVFWGVVQAVMFLTGMFWIVSNYQIPFALMLVYATDYKEENKDKDIYKY